MSLTVLAHDTDGIVNTSPDRYLGSPMYEVIGMHAPALVAVAAVAMWVWFVSRRVVRRGDAVAPTWFLAWRGAGLVERWTVGAVALAGVAHLALVPTHLDSVYGALFAIAGAAQTALVRRRLRTGAWSRWLRPVLLGSVLGYGFSSMTGEAPDQVGMLVKLAELFAVAATTEVIPRKRLVRLRATGGYLSVAVFVGVGAWAGAMQAGEGGHHLGETPPPGVLLPPGEDRDPTPAEQAAANALHARVVAGLAPYRDPAVAAAAGYAMDGIRGSDFHADNEALKEDGRTLDPRRPETLVWGVGASGDPVLLGAMFQMDHIGQTGPAEGAGPLVVWHAHDHICLTPVPPFLAGVAGPYGTCPAMTVTLPITNEMLHVWTIDGAPDPFGDLDEDWLEAELAER